MIQQAGKTVLFWRQMHVYREDIEVGHLLTGDGIKYSRKGIYIQKQKRIKSAVSALKTTSV